jgi:molybdate transport system permease protein
VTRRTFSLFGARVLMGVLGVGLLALLAWPLLALLLSSSPSELARSLSHPAIGSALRLSAWTTAACVCLTIVLGTPLSFLLAQAQGSSSTAAARVARATETLLLLPVVMPPAVAGLALLLAFGRRSALAQLLYPNESLAFTAAAVVLAQLFVAAPFYLQGAIAAFRRLDPKLVLTARSFGKGPWQVLLQVAIPLCKPALISAAALSCARALGEFGATLMFAGNTLGMTQTLPLAIYAALETDIGLARALALLQLGLSLGLLGLVRYADSASQRRGPHA